ncbi:MAG: hypothetical protein EPO39_17535, partial [Candidatus Manganitrophaceae bacterium]
MSGSRPLIRPSAGDAPGWSAPTAQRKERPPVAWFRIKLIFLTLIGGGTIILDQITKLLIQKAIRLNESVIVIQDFFSLTYIRNPGAAFGFFAEQSAGFRSIFFL